MKPHEPRLGGGPLPSAEDGRWRPKAPPALLDNLRDRPHRNIALERYARLSRDYEASTAKLRPVRSRAIELLALRPGETVFDIACGAGAMLAGLASRVGEQGRVVGVEQSPQMAALARHAASGIKQVEVLVAPAECFVAGQPADALAFVYAHDVQQSEQALANAFAQARPGARVVVAGLQLLPWWGLPINAWVVWGARHYLTTWRGLRQPWAPMLRWCPDLSVVERFHHGTSYLAAGTVTAQ